MLNMVHSRLERWAINYAKRRNLIKFIDQLDEKWDSSGVSFIDYCLLYHYVETRKPQYFLELGTGKSTHLIAKAMLDWSSDEHDGRIKLYSTETDFGWYEKAIEHLPETYKEFVEIHHSPFVPYSYHFLHGLCSRDFPDYPFDCCFVDRAATPGHGVNMDLMRVILRSEKPVDAIFDSQKKQVLGYFSLIDNRKFRFVSNGFTYLSGVSKEDLPEELADYTVDRRIKTLFNRRIRKTWRP